MVRAYGNDFLKHQLMSVLVGLRLQEETAHVKDQLAKAKSLDVLLKCFVSAKAGSFENLLVKLNLLHILHTVCDVHPNHVLLVEQYSIYKTVVSLQHDNGTMLVCELAPEIKPSLAPALKPSLRGIDTPVRYAPQLRLEQPSP
jgi:hypothetical protein